MSVRVGPFKEEEGWVKKVKGYIQVLIKKKVSNEIARSTHNMKHASSFVSGTRPSVSQRRRGLFFFFFCKDASLCKIRTALFNKSIYNHLGLVLYIMMSYIGFLFCSNVYHKGYSA